MLYPIRLLRECKESEKNAKKVGDIKVMVRNRKKEQTNRDEEERDGRTEIELNIT